MSKSDRNSGKKWSPSEVHQLRHIADQNTPTRVISLKMGRTPDAFYKKASEKHISLDPPNQSPYNRRNK